MKQQELKKLAVKDAERNRKVNMKGFDWQDNPDGQILDMAKGGRNFAKFDKNTQSEQ